MGDRRDVKSVDPKATEQIHLSPSGFYSKKPIFALTSVKPHFNFSIDKFVLINAS